ncbi:MAG: RNA polymerase sigma factor [Brevinema sp.]
MKYTEEEILQAASEVLAGNDEAFLKIYHNYYPMAVSIFRRVLSMPVREMDGLINEAFLLVFKSLKNFRNQAKLSTYAYRIILNFAFKEYKKRKKHAMVSSFAEEDLEIYSSVSGGSDAILEKYYVEQALKTLPKDMLEAIELYYYGDYSIKEIADMCDTTESAIKNRLFYAREKIREQLGGTLNAQE